MKVEKLCNFYASKYHLGLILLEYFNLKKIKKYKTITFIQDELEKEIELIKKHYCNIDAIKDIDFKTTENIYL